MKLKFLIGVLAIIIGTVLVALALANEKALVLHPRGFIAHEQLSLIITNVLLMLSIILPTYLLLFFIVWKCLKPAQKEYDPKQTIGPLGQLMLWVAPSIVVAVMAFVTWHATHQLDPYKPIASSNKTITVEVVALDWKWLFIYPEQGIATLNYFHIPERTPIQLKLAADGAPMNSFWIPQLAGQIYSMTGMTTQLHLMADGPGEYRGREVEINGAGYSDMTFRTRSSSQKEFDAWVQKVKNSAEHLSEEVYKELTKPSIDKRIHFYATVEKDLFHKIVHKYMYPARPVL